MAKRSKAVRPLATTVAGGDARTVVYVHGIGNKPPAEILKCQWDNALFGFDLGERSRLAYWVSRVTYPKPLEGTCTSGDTTALPGADATSSSIGRMRTAQKPEPSVEELMGVLEDELTKAERASLARLAAEIEAGAAAEPAVRTAGYGTRVLPLPAFMRRWITRQTTRLFLQDVHEYFFVEERRRLMVESVRERLLSGGGPFVVIGHSQGSMIAYDALIGLKTEPDIHLFLTIGSPLGLTEVQDQLKKLTGQAAGLRVPKNVRRWVNVADPLDPVCADKGLRNDIRANGSVKIEDIVDWNTDSPRDPHSGSGYLRMADVRTAVQIAVELELFQRVAPFTVARDLVRQMEMVVEKRHPVLIELREPRPSQALTDGAAPREPLDIVRQSIVGWIRENVQKDHPDLNDEELDLEVLNNYVSVRLKRAEIERLADDLGQTAIYRVYRNAEKRALLLDSAKVVQAPTAHRGYDAGGAGVCWAVLDTGIDVGHPHFQPNSILRVFDCVARTGPPVLRAPNAPATDRVGLDRNGHGSHVAGIIAGQCAVGSDPPLTVCGIAPSCQLVSYKVLNDNGEGSDAKIIKALDHILDTNRTATSLAIHGVNLSLGGAFDPEAFGCGDSPLCKRLRDLWRQGVVVVLAAGNEGFLEINQGGEAVGLNMDLSIGDPANLDEAVAVGSVHKVRPHHYGVSYFSSRGPTADGRCKPDVVAPGERILSCRAGGRGRSLQDLYVALSGTSMAAPHVSGVLACFLSARREFIGFPDKIKSHLLAHCTSLGRDCMHQGAGIPNLVKMLLNS